MSEREIQTTAGHIARVMERHPGGVLIRELINALVGPELKHSEAERAVRVAMERGDVVLNADMRLCAPLKEKA